MRSKFLVVAACSLFLTACEFSSVTTGPMHDEPVSIDAGSADRANVELDMGAGELNVHGGSSKLLDGQFEYNVEAWKPIVKSSINGVNATVTIKQPDSGHTGGNQHYKWDLQLNDKMLLDLAVNCGAGQAKLDLGSIQPRTISVHIGVGQVQLDLRGKPARDYEVTINGGIGQADIRLPQNVGLWVNAHGGIGSIDITGLEKKGDHWENSLYDNSKVNVKVNVNGGIGEIKISG